ncbi:hypothetical protein [Methylobacterium iners]|uniref:Uncharacterized protein n=1 Tax=Methylobacterium iners TaxID=418707 RepID=A0ABQ4RTM9_9HYPH|nr:hypothetical protein [Methylobacterium iners]GJD94145.1 hypothetical protein OCOJLMKI_1347 [Methylobacterium iners]
MAKRYFPLDTLTKFTEDATLTASGVIQRFGSDVVLKLGAGRQDTSLVLDVEAIKTTAGNERCVLVLQGCNNDSFTFAPIENLAHIELGASGARIGGARTSPDGRYALDVSNEQGGTEYTFVRLNAVLFGTAPSIKLSAYLSER